MDTWFLDVGREVANDPKVPYAVLPVPYERTVTFGHRTAYAPDAILGASHQIEDFDEEFRQPLGLQVQTLPPPDFTWLSDREAIVKIQTVAAQVMRNGQFLLGLGGEHTVTVPLVEAAHSALGCASVLQIDAHTDLREAHTDTRWSHACAMRRVRELGVATVHVGIRSMSAAEFAYANAEKVPIFWAADIVAATTDAWIDKVVAQLAGPVYVTVDVDGLDPAAMPGTGTPEPGGLTWYHLTALLRRVFARRHVVAADIVEVVPVPGFNVSEFVAARLAAKMLLYHKHGRR